MGKKRVELYMDADTHSRLLKAARELSFRGIGSKKKRIRAKVLKRAVTSLIEFALRFKIEEERLLKDLKVEVESAKNNDSDSESKAED